MRFTARRVTCTALTILDVVTGDTANDFQGSYGHPVPPGRPAPPDQAAARGLTEDRASGRGFPGAGLPGAAVALTIALAGFLVAAVGLTIQLLPRQFTPAQQERIAAWEVAGRWRDLSAGQVFPAAVRYAPPAALNNAGSTVTLTARRLGIAPQAPCRSSGSRATDPAAAAVLARNGCEAVLRASYTDSTGTYVATVGVVPFPSAAQAESARHGLGARRLRMSGGRVPGVRALPFAGTLASSFTDSRRQLAANVTIGPYLVMYTVGYADGRPLVPVTADSYADAEMTSFGAGVAESAANALGAPPAAPHCPGTPGC